MPQVISDTEQGAISAQFCTVKFANVNVGGSASTLSSGSSLPVLGGMQTFEADFENPIEIVGAMDGLARIRATGPYRLNWTASKFLIRKAALPDLLGFNAASMASVLDPYQNYPWRAMSFDIIETFAELTLGNAGNSQQLGISAGSGSWLVKTAQMQRWRISNANPYEFLMENISGLALGWNMGWA